MVITNLWRRCRTLAQGGDLSSRNCYWGRAVCLLCCRRHCSFRELFIDSRPYSCCIGITFPAAADISAAGSFCLRVRNSIGIVPTIRQVTGSLYLLVLARARCSFGSSWILLPDPLICSTDVACAGPFSNWCFSVDGHFWMQIADFGCSSTFLSWLLCSSSSWRWHLRLLSGFQLSVLWAKILLSSFWTPGWRSSCSLFTVSLSSSPLLCPKTLTTEYYAVRTAHTETDLLCFGSGFELSSFACTFRSVRCLNVPRSSCSASVFQQVSLSEQPVFSFRCRSSSLCCVFRIVSDMPWVSRP